MNATSGFCAGNSVDPVLNLSVNFTAHFEPE